MAETAKKKQRDTKDSDIALVYGKSEDGKSYGVLRQRDQEIQVGLLRPIEHGKPIQGELVRLRPRDESPLVFDVETHYRPTVERTASGPPKVANAAYRDGWDSIWSRRPESKTLN